MELQFARTNIFLMCCCSDIAELLEGQEQAASASKGVHNKDQNAIARSIRPMSEVESSELFEQLKGQNVTGMCALSHNTHVR